MAEKTKLIVTLGPSTNKEEDLIRLKDKGVDFVRVNMSHSSLQEVEYFMRLAKKIGLPFVVDTQGSQVRTGDLTTSTIELDENEEVKLSLQEIIGTREMFSLKPSFVTNLLQKGDLISVDFDTVTLLVTETSTIDQGYILVKAVTGGILGRNKAALIHGALQKPILLPTLTETDLRAIKLGLKYGVSHIAASFIRSGKAIGEVRRATQDTMKIISKVECLDALHNLNEIIDNSDYLLIDRGDLSKEIPIEKIPFTQKIILHRAKQKNVGVFVATNLLETMTERRKPTRAEVHDVLNTIIDGAAGLALAGETAIGKYPLACVNMINKLIKHAQLAVDVNGLKDKEDAFVKKLEDSNYLLNMEMSSSLIAPHGGRLVDRMAKQDINVSDLPQVKLDENRQRDVEQIAIGTYSPLEGFMGQKDFQSVLDRMRLANGLPWPLPIYLDVSEEQAGKLIVGRDVALIDDQEKVMAILHLTERYIINKTEVAEKIYRSLDPAHPGVQAVMNMKNYLLGGKITLLKRKDFENKEYELTPLQTRKLFEDRGWSKVVGFHTRNVIHNGHEFIQLSALDKTKADGLFVHPAVGKKKTGDYHAKYIIKSYELMNHEYYPKNKVIFGTFSTYSRYAGPREALFTALCRKNFGCSHFIVGRDHTGVGNYYHPKASHNIFDRFPDLGIIPVKFENVFYSDKLKAYQFEAGDETGDRTETRTDDLQEEDKLQISGTKARQMLESGEPIPEWFMRPKISQMIQNAIKNGEEVFVK